MTRSSRLASFAGVVALALLGACESHPKTMASDTPAKNAVNTVCPLGGHEADGTITTSYKGKTVAFCCDDCVTEWDKMSEEKRTTALAKVTTTK